MNRRTTLIAGTVLAGLGVALGAVGAHAWKEILTESGRVETYETAVQYQLYHAMALLVVGFLMRTSISANLTWAGRLFLVGPLLFSGSLYALSLSSMKWVVYITPVGGILMITGWLMLLLHFIFSRE